MASKFRKGDTVTVAEDVHAWYSRYGMNPERVIRAGEPLEVTATNAPSPTRPNYTYDVAKTADGWQVSTVETAFVRLTASERVRALRLATL